MKMRVAASLATLLILVGCGSSEDENNLTHRDKAYIKVLREEITGVKDMSDKKLVAIGIEACATMGKTDSLFDTIESVETYGLTASDASYLTGAAIAAYCPEVIEESGR